MTWCKFLAIITGVIISCSSPLLAADADPAQPLPVSTLEISSTSLKQVRPEASCELKVKEKYEYYDIGGSSLLDLQREIKHNGTKWGDGLTYAAVTTWNVHYDYDVTEDDGRCSVKSVKTSVEIVYHLPRWVPSASVGPLMSSWDDYMAHLKQHEFGHKDIAVKSAGEINEELASLQNFRNQSDLEKEAKRRTNEKLRELKELQVAYDAKTHHGATQGAVLGAVMAAK